MKWRTPFGWSRAQSLTFAAGALLVFILVPLITWRLGWTVNGIGNAVLWASGVVLLFYALETQAMRQEMVAANKMGVQPLLVMTIENPELAADAVIFVKNIGKGPALRIRFANIEFFRSDNLNGTLFRTAGTFYTDECLEAGKERPVRGGFGEEEEARDYGGDWIAALNRRTARANYRITITYEDMNGGGHESVMQMGVDGTRLLRYA